MNDQEESLKPLVNHDLDQPPLAELATTGGVAQVQVGFSERVDDGELKALFLRLERAVERGDYALARRDLSQAREYIEREQLGEDVVVIEAMSHYTARLGTDPMAVYVLLLCVLSVAMIALALYAR